MENDDNALILPQGINAPISTAMAVSMIALNLAVKYMGASTVTDGNLYMQFKSEGRNLIPNSLQLLFDYAREIELHLMESEARINSMICGTVNEILDKIIDESKLEE